jgi:hypothetical protein
MGLGLEGAAVGIGASALTLMLSKLRWFCKQGTDGSCARGCGFTNHSLFDQNEVRLEKETINGVDVIYLKQPGHSAEPDDESSSDDEMSNP